jgi:hypothetical protein
MTLPELINQLTEAKAAEAEANANRLTLETEILNHPDVAKKLKLEGTTSFKGTGLSIATGFTRSWDAEKLWELSVGIKEEFFPFKQSLTEDRKAAKEIEADYPELWAQLSSALTLKPKKPSLTLKAVAS